MSQMNNPCDTCQKECPHHGCKAWRDWWVKYWNTYICIRPKPKNREAWQYEHPDREREMALKKEEEMTAAERLVRVGMLEGPEELEIWEDGNHDA